MQYGEWLDELHSIDIYERSRADGMPHGTDVHDPTFDISCKRESLIHRINLVNESAKIAGGEISEILLKAVTRGLSFPDLDRMGVPFGRDYFYARYRRYFYELDKIRE